MFENQKGPLLKERQLLRTKERESERARWALDVDKCSAEEQKKKQRGKHHKVKTRK